MVFSSNEEIQKEVKAYAQEFTNNVRVLLEKAEKEVSQFDRVQVFNLQVYDLLKTEDQNEHKSE